MSSGYSRAEQTCWSAPESRVVSEEGNRTVAALKDDEALVATIA
jgi:hypothetical protein